MKKILPIIFSVLFIIAPAVLTAQTLDPKISISKADKYSLKSSDGEVSLLEGNVALTADKLKISKAEKVVIDKKLNKIIVIGLNEFSFNGKMVIVPTFDGKHTSLEYIPGENVAYIK